MELVLHVCLGTMMADSSGSTTGGYSFRFFSPEEVDQILCEGAKRGRAGSNTAIERILKHESGLERGDLWERIRQLKNVSAGRLTVVPFGARRIKGSCVRVIGRQVRETKKQYGKLRTT